MTGIRAVRPWAAALAFLLACFLPLAAESGRGLSLSEIGRGLHAPGPVVQVDAGRVVDGLRLSADGRWLAYAVFSDDIKDNQVWLVASDGSSRRRVATPHGYKNSPLPWGASSAGPGELPSALYLSLAGTAMGDLPDGIYRRSLQDDAAPWELWQSGSFRDLALSPDGRFLAASSGNWRAATIRSTARVWPLDPRGQKSGPAWDLAPGLRGQLRRISFDESGALLIIECAVAHPDFPYGRPQVYAVDNRPGSDARLLLRDASGPVYGRGGAKGRVFFLSDGGAVSSLDLLSGRETELVTLDGLVGTALEWDSRSHRLFLAVQESATVAGVLAIGIE